MVALWARDTQQAEQVVEEERVVAAEKVSVAVTTAKTGGERGEQGKPYTGSGSSMCPM